LSTRIRAILIIVFGLILLSAGVGATILLIQRINAQTAAAQQQSQVVKLPVVVLTRDMHLGDRISPSDLSITQMPVGVAPRDALSTVDTAIGRFIKSDMVKGEMVLQHNLADPTNNNHDLSFILSNDHVLMAFPSADLMSRQMVIQRGDIIDILATLPGTIENPASNSTGTTTGTTPVTNQPPSGGNTTLDAFQKVSVTALVVNVPTDQNGNPTGPGSISSYLLALNPQDALILKHLKDGNAIFDIVLRAPTSKDNFNLTPVTDQYINELYGLGIQP
jgi:Flp pilus assembly protein CpaB